MPVRIELVPPLEVYFFGYFRNLACSHSSLTHKVVAADHFRRTFFSRSFSAPQLCRSLHTRLTWHLRDLRVLYTLRRPTRLPLT